MNLFGEMLRDSEYNEAIERWLVQYVATSQHKGELQGDVESTAYTEWFEKMYRKFTKVFPDKSRTDLIAFLISLRKQRSYRTKSRSRFVGRILPYAVRRTDKPNDSMSDHEVEVMDRRYAMFSIPLDRIAYTDTFEDMYDFFRHRFRGDVTRNVFWRLFLNVRKSKKLQRTGGK